MSETDGRPNTGPGKLLATGRKLAEQYTLDSSASYHLASLAYPQLAKKALDAAMAEEQYFARCQALGGISMDDARQILDDTLAWADQRGLAAEAVWPRAWSQAIEKAMQSES